MEVTTISPTRTPSVINCLLIFVPIGIVAGFLDPDPIVVFILNALAIVPLAVTISSATESLASRLGDITGALLNVSVGNAAELIIFFTALAKNQIEIVKGSLLGSVLANSLLVLGSANLFGGLRYRDQLFDRAAGRLSVCLLDLGLVVALVPVNVLASTHKPYSPRVIHEVLSVSRGISLCLIVVYILYLSIQMLLQSKERRVAHNVTRMNGHTYLALSELAAVSENRQTTVTRPQGVPASFRSPVHRRFRSLSIVLPSLKAESNTKDSSLHPDLPRREDTDHRSQETGINLSDGTSALPPSPPSTPDNTHDHDATFPEDTTTESTRAGTVGQLPAPVQEPHRPDTPSETVSSDETTTLELSEESDKPNTPPLCAAIALLVFSTSLAAVCTEFAVDTIPAIVDSWRISRISIGFIVLPFVGNAAEHVTAAKMALRNRMVLAKSVAVESATQVVLCITPAIVLLAWLRGRRMDLQFDIFETGCIAATAIVVTVVICFGRSGWKQGVFLHCIYALFAVGSVVYRGPESDSS